MLNENESLLFKLRLYCQINFDEDPYCNETEYYKSYRGEILLKTIDEEDNEIEKMIGYIEFWYVEGDRAYYNDINIVDYCDSIEQELYEYSQAIYKNGYIDEKLIDMPLSNDILVLHRIEIIKEYQGRELGILISQKIVQSFGHHCGGILIRPSPIQYSEIAKKDNWMEKYNSKNFVKGKKLATDKLLNYWKKIDKNIIKSNDKNIIIIPHYSI